MLVEGLTGTTSVDALGAEVLDHELDVIALGERELECLEQHVGPLAPDQAAHEQEPRWLDLRVPVAITRG